MPQSINLCAGHEHHRNCEAMTLALRGRYVDLFNRVVSQLVSLCAAKKVLHSLLECPVLDEVLNIYP